MEKKLKHQQFWSRMEKNSQVVNKMQPWVKGSPINQRTHPPTKPAGTRVSAMPATRDEH